MSSCDDLRSGDQIKYYSCTNCTGCTYLKTVSQLISDEACTDENRIIQCELENENVTANFDIATTVSKHAYLKSFVPGSGQVITLKYNDHNVFRKYKQNIIDKVTSLLMYLLFRE